MLDISVMAFGAMNERGMVSNFYFVILKHFGAKTLNRLYQYFYLKILCVLSWFRVNCECCSQTEEHFISIYFIESSAFFRTKRVMRAHGYCTTAKIALKILRRKWAYTETWIFIFSSFPCFRHFPLTFISDKHGTIIDYVTTPVSF